MLTIKCPCGEEKRVSPSRFERTKYCCLACKRKYAKRRSGLKYIIHTENPTWFKKGDERLIGNKFREGKTPWNKEIKTGLKPLNAFKQGETSREKNVKWVGEYITEQGGRQRAQHWFDKKPCEIC